MGADQPTDRPPEHASWRRARRNTLLALLALQVILLYLLTSGLLFRLTINQGQSPFGNFTLAVLMLVGLPSVATFLLPSAIGALCRTWQGAVVLAVAPWWLVLFLHAGTLLRAAAATPDQPAWLMSNAGPLLLASFALFAALGLLGWLARQALPAER
jgi:hypothetical protein